MKFLKPYKQFLAIILVLTIVFLTPIISAAPKTILFSPSELINITGIMCIQGNNTICSDGIGCNITVLNQTGGFLVANETMDIQPQGFRSFDTTLTFSNEIELSAVTRCDNGGIEEFVIVIKFDENAVDTTYGIYSFLVATASVFFILGLNKDRFIYKTLSGFMLMLMGLNIVTNGFPNISNFFITYGSGSIIIGLGAVFILSDVERLGGLLK